MVKSTCIAFYSVIYIVTDLLLVNTLFIHKSYAQEKVIHVGQQVQSKCINIKSLEFNGNISFSDIRLKMRMKSWHSSLLPGDFNCYNEGWIKKDILTLTEFYRKNEFSDIGIDYQLTTDSKGKVTVEINIDEGLQYEIIFKGNSFFSEKELRKKIDLVKKGNANNIALSKAVVDIKNIYLEAGFENITVNFNKNRKSLSYKPFKIGDKKLRDVEIWSVEFLINEGVRTIVNHLKIEGNKIVSKNEILDSMLTREKESDENIIKVKIGGYNSDVLDKDISAIELLYFSKGFINAKISKRLNKLKINRHTLLPSTTKNIEHNHPPTLMGAGNGENSYQDVHFIDIVITIKEGVQTIVDNVNIVGFDSKYLTELSLKHAEPFREYMVKSDENALSMIVSELGYPHVKVKGDIRLNSNKAKADITWHVDKGKFTRFGKIHYSGNIRLKDDVIAKRVQIDSGQPFSLKKIFSTEKLIRESSAVKSVQITSPELTLMKDSPDIEIVIEESKPYFVEVALGYDTEQNLYIDTRVGDNDFSGREIDAWVEASVSGIGYRAESGLKKPFFFGTKIDATGNLYVEDKEEFNKTFGVKSWGYETGFSRYIFIREVTAGLNFKYENRTVYGDPENIDIEELESRNILVTSLSFGYDSRDSSVRPTKGFLSSYSVDLYSGFDNDLDRFLKYQIDLRTYLSPSKYLSSFNSPHLNRVTFALRGRLGYIKPFKSDNSVAQDQLFFLGGTSNVRGFNENMLEYDSTGNSIGGDTAINSTLEARVDLPSDFELNFFVDTGKIGDLTNKLDLAKNLESRGFRSSVGTGLRYITPIGPVGILYGYKLNPEDGESPGRVHLSVGYTF